MELVIANCNYLSDRTFDNECNMIDNITFHYEIYWNIFTK